MENLSCIQTVDSASLCEKLNKGLGEQNRALDIFVQVKISEEESKSGVAESELSELVGWIKARCSKLTFRGFITIGPVGDIDVFRKLRILKERLEHESGLENLEISMVMSAEYKEAIVEGATVVRVGSALFSERVYKQK